MMTKPAMLQRIESIPQLSKMVANSQAVVQNHLREGWPLSEEDVYTAYLSVAMQCNQVITQRIGAIVYSNADVHSVAQYLLASTKEWVALSAS